LILFLLACNTLPEPAIRTPHLSTEGIPVAGMAEGFSDLPIGAPLGGYTGRCDCFGNDGEVDKRDSQYSLEFNPSAGLHTRPKLQALWLDNGDQDLVLLKADAIYSFDDMVEDLEYRLSEATGRDLEGRVVLATNHSHSQPGNYQHGVTWYLGGDRYNEEIYQRFTASLEEVALAAFDSRVDASIGIGMARDWDPDDRVYRDRREANDALEFFEDIPAGPYKDPNLSLLRVDTAEGDPMGLFFAFGIHGTVLGGSNQMWSGDAAGAVELAVQERFSAPMVVGHLQLGGGDASPVGVDDEFAQLESLGELAADTIVALWEATPTSSDPIHLETVTHSIDTSRDTIEVTRNGTVDLRYAPYDPDTPPDEILYAEDGSIISPIDEFNTQYGGAFCGEDIPLIPGVSIGSTTYPYSSCVDVETISWVIRGFFDLEEDQLQLPLPESLRAKTTASRLGPLPIREPDGSLSQDDVLLAFFPGETTAMYTEQFRRRALAELGMSHVIPVGYAQDHEGYLMIPEDWLTGGYEPNINVWGPLQGEHIMEGVLDMSRRWLLTTDVIEPQDPTGVYQPTEYDWEDLPVDAPDLSPQVGTVLDSIPTEDFYIPLPDVEARVQPEVTIPRVQGAAQLAWIGGDPAVDMPNITLQLEAEDGTWTDVLSPSGRPIDEAMPDILLAHTPDPLYPSSAEQTHRWWVIWQAVSHNGARAAIPTGTYRLHVQGHHYTGGADHWPWPSESYELSSEPFDVVAGQIELSISEDSLQASLTAPAWGYRLISLDGSSTGANPLEDPILTWELSDGSTQVSDAEPTSLNGWSVFNAPPPEGAIAATVVDAAGNQGRIEL
jgi:neutral ceramidase